VFPIPDDPPHRKDMAPLFFISFANDFFFFFFSLFYLLLCGMKNKKKTKSRPSPMATLLCVCVPYLFSSMWCVCFEIVMCVTLFTTASAVD
jgi:hypothetical protein